MPDSGSARLLGPAAVTAHGRFHPIDVHARSFWPASEHLLAGVPTLVGMAFPALLAEAFPEKALRIGDLRWIRPLRPAELESGTVTLAVTPDGAATLSGRTSEGHWQTFAKAKVEVLNASKSGNPDLGTLDLTALAGRCADPHDAPPFQRRSGIVEVSERWNCLEQIAAGDGEVLGWLRSRGNEPSLRLHPGLLDVAAGMALNEPGLVPAGCATIIAVRFPARGPARPCHATRDIRWRRGRHPAGRPQDRPSRRGLARLAIRRGCRACRGQPISCLRCRSGGLCRSRPAIRADRSC